MGKSKTRLGSRLVVVIQCTYLWTLPGHLISFRTVTVFKLIERLFELMDENVLTDGEREVEILRLDDLPVTLLVVHTPQLDRIVEPVDEFAHDRFPRSPGCKLQVEEPVALCLSLELTVNRRLRHPPYDLSSFIAELFDHAPMGPSVDVLDDVMQQHRRDQVRISHPQVLNQDERSAPQVFEVPVTAFTLLVAKCVLCRTVRPHNGLVPVVAPRVEFADQFCKALPVVFCLQNCFNLQ